MSEQKQLKSSKDFLYYRYRSRYLVFFGKSFYFFAPPPCVLSSNYSLSPINQGWLVITYIHSMLFVESVPCLLLIKEQIFEVYYSASCQVEYPWPYWRTLFQNFISVLTHFPESYYQKNCQSVLILNRNLIFKTNFNPSTVFNIFSSGSYYLWYFQIRSFYSFSLILVIDISSRRVDHFSSTNGGKGW